MNNFTIQTALSDDDLKAIIEGVVKAIKPLLDAKPQRVDGETMAKILGVSVATLDRIRRDGRVPSSKAGTRRLYNPVAVLEAIDATNEKGAADA